MFLEIPEGRDPIMHVWGSMVPGIGPAAAAFAQSIYEHSTFELDTFEAARLRIAQINGCLFCNDWRTERDGAIVGTSFAASVADWRSQPRGNAATNEDGSQLSERALLAAEFAERWATDHHNIDDKFWATMRQSFTDAELVELNMCLGSWMSFGRLNRVFGLDAACTLPVSGKSASPDA